MIDSDEEDSDCLSHVNGLNYPERNTMIRLKGPHYESTRMCNLPHNFEKQRYRNEFADRDLFKHRPTSPMSYRSNSDRLPCREYGYRLMPPPHNVHQSFYNGGYASGRPGSPTMSMMSMGSINSVTSDVIVSAVKSGKFDKYQLRSIINEANNKLMKGRVRKRIAKRRNLKMFLKHARRASGGESGDQAMDSSSSSDDCRSTRTGVTRYGGYRNYASSSKYLRKNRNCDDARSVRTDFTDLRKTIREHNAYRNCSGEFEQTSFKNMFNLGPRQMYNTSMARSNYSIGPAHSTTINTTLRDRFKNSFMLPVQRFNKLTAQPALGHVGNRNYNANPQIERFKSSFLLPSQRFNKTSTMVHISEDRDDNLEERNSRSHSPILKPRYHKERNTTQDLRTDTDEDQCDVTVLEKSAEGRIETPKSIRKRKLSSSDESLPRRNKLKKHATPEKVANKVKNAEPYHHIDKKQGDFSFAKPTLPVKKPTVPKLNNLKNRIGHSEVPPTINNADCVPNNKECTTEKLNASEDPSDSALYTSDMSMRPSFIKRKLFTQTLEVTESKNVSSDSSPSSPQKQKRPYTNDQNEKNKARKLVSSSSYMAREVADDSNLLDLIHKIVPPDRMNITQLKPQNKTNIDNKQKEFDDKWDISSIITTNDVDAGSDTFTNEDIFENNDSDFVVKPKKTVKNSPPKPTVQNVKTVVQNVKSAAQNTKPMAQTIKPAAQTAKPVQTMLKKCAVVIDRFNNVEDKSEDSALLAQETFGGGGGKNPVADVAVRSVFHYANKFWNCDSESDALDTPNYRRSRNVLLNDTPPAGLHKKNSQASKNMPMSKENAIENNKASVAVQPVNKTLIKKSIPLIKVNDKPSMEARPRRTKYDSSMDSSQNSSTMKTRFRDSKIKATNNNLKTTVNKENGKVTGAKPVPAKNVLKPVANKTASSNDNVNLNDSQKSKQNKNSKNNNEKVQDKSFTPTRQSTRLKSIKHDSSSDAMNDTLKHGSKTRKPYQRRSENKENTKISRTDSTIKSKITKPVTNKYLNNISNKTLVNKKPERAEEPYRHVVRKVQTTRRALSTSETSLTPTRRSTRIQLKHDTSSESNNITRSFIYRSIQLGLRRQKEV